VSPQKSVSWPSILMIRLICGNAARSRLLYPGCKG
jgi:hypothetical protein